MRHVWIWALATGCGGATQEATDQAPAPCTPLQVWVDQDGDGWGGTVTLEVCPEDMLPQHVEQPGDCNDAAASVNPGAEEICDGLDTDCSGDPYPEDELTTAWYLDDDGDGYGDGEPTVGCQPGPDWTDLDGDCDDTDAGANPDEIDVCGDGVDSDCAPELSLNTVGSGYVTVPHDDDLSFQGLTSEARTVEAWVWVHSLSTTFTEYGIVDKREDESTPGSAQTDYTLFLLGDRVYFGTGSSSDACAWMTAQMRIRDQWVHLAGVLRPTGAQAGTKSLFVDGVEVASCTYSQRGRADPPSDLHVATGRHSVQQPLRGFVDEVRISAVDRYPSGDFTPAPRFEPDADTLLLLHFDEGQGTTADDASGLGHDGDLRAGATWEPDSPCLP